MTSAIPGKIVERVIFAAKLEILRMFGDFQISKSDICYVFFSSPSKRHVRLKALSS